MADIDSITASAQPDRLAQLDAQGVYSVSRALAKKLATQAGGGDTRFIEFICPVQLIEGFRKVICWFTGSDAPVPTPVVQANAETGLPDTWFEWTGRDGGATMQTGYDPFTQQYAEVDGGRPAVGDCERMVGSFCQAVCDFATTNTLASSNDQVLSWFGDPEVHDRCVKLMRFMWAAYTPDEMRAQKLEARKLETRPKSDARSKDGAKKGGARPAKRTKNEAKEDEEAAGAKDAYNFTCVILVRCKDAALMAQIVEYTHEVIPTYFGQTMYIQEDDK